MSALRVSHSGSPGAYIGLIKRGSVVLWRCPHKHTNRDADTKHTAARSCASRVLAAVLDPDAARKMIEALRRGAPHFQYAWQAAEWQQTLARHEWALQQADALRGDMEGTQP